MWEALAQYGPTGNFGVYRVMIYLLLAVMSVVSLLIIGHAFDEGE